MAPKVESECTNTMNRLTPASESGTTDVTKPVADAVTSTVGSASKMGIWCLKIVIAEPDYKRPSARVIVEHYKTKEEAEVALAEHEEDFIKGNDTDRATFEDCDALFECVYGNSYMDMRPFDSSIFEVEFK